MIYVKFLSATCAIGATLAIAVALRTEAAPLIVEVRRCRR